MFYVQWSKPVFSKPKIGCSSWITKNHDVPYMIFEFGKMVFITSLCQFILISSAWFYSASYVCKFEITKPIVSKKYYSCTKEKTYNNKVEYCRKYGIMYTINKQSKWNYFHKTWLIICGLHNSILFAVSPFRMALHEFLKFFQIQFSIMIVIVSLEHSINLQKCYKWIFPCNLSWIIS